MGSIRIKCQLRYSVDHVWATLTDTDALSNWLMPNDFQPVEGHSFEFISFQAPGFSGAVDCKVLKVDQCETLSFAWRSGDLDSVVSIKLRPNKRGTEMRLHHSGFEWGDWISFLSHTVRWHHSIKFKLPESLRDQAGHLQTHPASF